MKKHLYLVSPILFLLTIAHAQTAFAYAKGLFMGTVQFPKSMTDIPNFRIYFGGNKIQGDIHKNSKRVTFGLPDDKKRTSFTLIVTETIQFESEENTILYLKLADSQPYKFYSLQLLKLEDESFDKEKGTRKEAVYEWIVEEQKVSLEDGRIPDDAIILCMNPKYIDRLEGGNSVELPKVFIKSDAVQLAGFDDSWTKVLLSSLDTDAIHANLHQEVKQDHQKTRITLIS